MLITKISTSKFIYAFIFNFNYEILNFCRAIKNKVGYQQFTFFEKAWRFNNLDIVEMIKNRFPEVIIDTAILPDIEKFKLEKQSLELRIKKAEELKKAVDTDFIVNNIKGELYPYQKIGVKFLINANGRAMLYDAPGVGKSFQALAYIAHSKIPKTLVICPASAKGVWVNETRRWTKLKPYTITSKTDLTLDVINEYDVLISNYDILHKFLKVLTTARIDSLVVDECFTGETEILTNEGFKRFDCLSRKEKVAQWDNGDISFVKPLRYIKRKHNGEMTLFNVKYGINVLMTPGHNQLIIGPNGNIIKKPISECKFNSRWRIPTAGFSTEKSGKLSSIERLYIATQADGSINSTRKNHVTIDFHFVKERKIKRLQSIAAKAGIAIHEVKHSNRHRKRFLMHMPLGTTKDITKHIKYPMSREKAQEIIEEMVEWDGSRLPGGKQYYFSSKNKSQSDFYAQVAVIAGHTCYQSIEKDERKDTFSDIHRLFITLNKPFRGTQQCKISTTQYVGDVYCVEVPSKAIVVRHKGFTFISGNCQYIKESSSRRSKCAKLIGRRIPSIILLSGTPVLNRPIELFNSLNLIDPVTWSDYYHFAKTYCDGHQGTWGFEAKGATNIKELQEKISHYFLRRTKEMVLPELPLKTFIDVPVELEDDARKKYDYAENSFIEYLREIKQKNSEEINRSLSAEKLTKLNELRQLTSEGKIETAKEIIDNILESGEKIVVFSVYNAPLNILKEHYGDKAVVLTGKVKEEDKNQAIRDFQDKDDCIIFLGGMKSAGVAITLTAAANVLAIDFPWTNADLEQAVNRIHRPGQKANHATIYQLIAEDTIDQRMQNILAGKKEISDQLIDGKKVSRIGQDNMINELLKSFEKE